MLGVVSAGIALGIFGGILLFHEDEELQVIHQQLVALGDGHMRRMFGGRKAAKAFSEAAEKAAQRASNLERILQLRKEIGEKKAALRDGQQKVLALIEEFIGRGMEPRQGDQGLVGAQTVAIG
ncbi:hypothetical protein [Acidithiobacillus sulfuriphilus]|uniref:Uncharacterized protein n=1 Tax=Acidithiobacillus sulfuriphilus TaxID=1867749 RepID=A0ACD5HR39_9PROT|nr:hypothetical protein [Acidithiobacillus sulfuriphilus]